MVEINIFSTKEVERAIIYIPAKIFPANPAVKKKILLPFCEINNYNLIKKNPAPLDMWPP